jgi:hypothetical protein
MPVSALWILAGLYALVIGSAHCSSIQAIRSNSVGWIGTLKKAS